MHTLMREQIQQYSLNKKLIAALRTATTRHIDCEDCVQAHINPHDALYILTIIQQHPDCNHIHWQCPETDE